MKIENLNYPTPKLFGQEEKKPQGDEFWQRLKKELQEVDQAQKTAEKRLVAFATGQDPDLSGLTLSLARAEVSFRFLLQVRNKIIQAYEEIMRMQL